MRRDFDFLEFYGTTSSSDGQRFKAGGVGEATGSVNARYGNEPGATFCTHVSDQYAPFHVKLISATVRDAMSLFLNL